VLALVGRLPHVDADAHGQRLVRLVHRAVDAAGLQVERGANGVPRRVELDQHLVAPGAA
jgi:hypothetical protein